MAFKIVLHAKCSKYEPVRDILDLNLRMGLVIRRPIGEWVVHLLLRCFQGMLASSSQQPLTSVELNET